MNQTPAESNLNLVGPPSLKVVVRRAAFWVAVVSMAGLAVVGVVREYRTRMLTAPMNDGVPAQHQFANALEVMRRVAARFRQIEQTGPIDTPAPWPFRTAADNLLTGGDCGHAAEAIGAVFYRRGRPFRIIQVNVHEMGAGHVMTEVMDDSRRWVLIDPLDGHGFRSPTTGRYLGIDEIQRLPDAQRGWLDRKYREEWSLFAPYRRSNWERIGPVAGVLRSVMGETWMREFSLRATFIEPGWWLGMLSALGVVLALGIRARLRSAPKRSTGAQVVPVRPSSIAVAKPVEYEANAE